MLLCGLSIRPSKDAAKVQGRRYLFGIVDLLGSYSGGLYCFLGRVDHGITSPLSQDRGERVLCRSST